jgi:hypothetical protein
MKIYRDPGTRCKTTKISEIPRKSMKLYENHDESHEIYAIPKSSMK